MVHEIINFESCAQTEVEGIRIRFDIDPDDLHLTTKRDGVVVRDLLSFRGVGGLIPGPGEFTFTQ